MTFKEKLRLEHHMEPLSLGEAVCPRNYGYEDNCPCNADLEMDCGACWDREVPKEGPPSVDDIRKFADECDAAAKMHPHGGSYEIPPTMVDLDLQPDDPMIIPTAPQILDSGDKYEDVREANEEFRKVVDAMQNLAKPDDRVTVIRKKNGGISATIEPYIKDSGDRTEFATGAVRDMREGKGRCDLMPLEVVANCLYKDNDKFDSILYNIRYFMKEHATTYLYNALRDFCEINWGSPYTMLLEVAKHFEEGAKKYGESNWQKGIPVHCYIDSAVRHYLKWCRGDIDEPHDRAFCWNLMCCIWEVDYSPRSGGSKVKEEKNA